MWFLQVSEAGGGQRAGPGGEDGGDGEGGDAGHAASGGGHQRPVLHHRGHHPLPDGRPEREYRGTVRPTQPSFTALFVVVVVVVVVVVLLLLLLLFIDLCTDTTWRKQQVESECGRVW